MSSTSRRTYLTRRALAALLLMAGPAAAEVRYGSFPAPSLDGREARYAVDLPPSYEESARRYPVLYVLHGLFESHSFWERRGLAAVLQRLRERAVVGEFLVVAVDGGNSFFVNSPAGRYEDLVTRDLVAHVEATYRVIPGRGARALLGISMGGYAALRLALTHPERFAVVSAHSAMLLERIPSPDQGAGRWHMEAFHRVFGNPIDARLWNASDPLLLASAVDPRAVPALYFDCGAEDRYGLVVGNRDLDRRLSARGVAHTFASPPGDHGYEYVLSVLERSLRFTARGLGAEGRAAPTVPASPATP